MFQTLIDPAFLAAENGGTPVLDLNFAALKSLDSRITFTRGSSGTYVDSSGLVQTASSNVARFTHDPVTGRSLGLLIEGSRTNLITYSEQINNAAWIHVGGTHTANQTTAPSGELTADLFTENSAASTQHRLFQIPTVANGTTYTFSVFVKRASGSRQFSIILNTGTVVARVYFNLDTGTVGTVVAGSGTITAYPNGWYRCTATGVSGGLTGTTFLQMCNGTTSGSETYSGDGTSGLYIWGAQLEAGEFPTSYIATTSATVQRAADVAQMTGTNFSSWFSQNNGTFSVEFIAPPNASADRRLLSIGPSPASLDLVYQYTRNISIDNTIVASLLQSSNTATVGSLSKAIGVFKSGDYAVCLNGGIVATSSASNTITADSLTIGSYAGGTAYLSGNISRLRYYRVRLPNASLQAITT